MGNGQSSADDLKITTLYQEVCNSYHAIEDFRGRLLGFLPLASGAGIFFLLNGLPTSSLKSAWIIVPIGFLGALITVGLFFYEARGLQLSQSFEKDGKAP